MEHLLVSVFGLGGDALTAPENTISAYWAALGGGATGFATGVKLSKDDVVVCSNHDNFGPTCGDARKVAELNWGDIVDLDAGSTFRSTVLNSDHQPTGEAGTDQPWLGNLPKKRALGVPQLSEVLKLFARRCDIIIVLSDANARLAEKTLAELQYFGVMNRVLLACPTKLFESFANEAPAARRILIADPDESPADQLALAEGLGAEALYLDWDSACPSGTAGLFFQPDLKAALETSDLRLFLGSDAMPFAATPAHFTAIAGIKGIAAIVARGVLPTVDAITPASLIVSDWFEETRIDQSTWSAGYSHANQDTEIFQNCGLHIKIKQGGSYSGAATVCVLPVHGRFDAQTGFHVSNPAQATTLELAAICIEPGYHRIDHSDLDSRRVNLTFDVHGAPPYASSERDENDGFRCGWNNGFNPTRIDDDWTASSVNMYNKYGRDVGNGAADNPEGRLRLVRNGQVFSSYYTDKDNAAWVCSGAMLVQNMADDVYLRLAAKHWSKGGTPPKNHVQFKDFRLYQF